MTAADQPSFLCFVTDQQRADFLGCMGHPVLRTPHIDGIAARGTRFDRFYVASPICMPNRASLMTGRPTSLHGVRHNGIPLAPSAATFTDVLREAGYATALIGKSHLSPMSGRPSPLGPSPAREALLPEAVKGRFRNARDLHEPAPDAIELPFYGFDHVELASKHSVNAGGHHDAWLRDRGPDIAAWLDPRNHKPHNYSVPQAHRTALPEALYPTAFIRDRAVAFLRNHERSRPFFLFVSFPDPHHPFSPPGKYWDMYDPDDMPLDASIGAHRNPPPPLEHVRRRSAAADNTNARTMKAFAATPHEIQEAAALTCGMIAMIDDAVGDILAAATETELAASTVTIFTADHGDYLGDHGLLLKGPLHFQSVVRVPFIWREPGQTQARTVTEMASTLDIAKSVLRRCGLQPYNGIHGLDLAPLVTGDGAFPCRERLLIEEEIDNSEYGFEPPKKIRTLLTDRFRFTVFLDEPWGELYDLAADPLETRNLWDDAGHAEVKSGLYQTMAEELIRTTETSPWPHWVA